MMAKWVGWRKVLAAIAGVVVFVAIAPGVRAESFKITSTPAGASVV